MLAHLSINRKLLLPGLSALLVLVLSLSAFWANRYANRLNADFEATVVLSKTFVIPSLVSSVWDFEVELTETNLSGLRSFEPFLFARVLSSGDVFAEVQTVPELPVEWERVIEKIAAMPDPPSIVTSGNIMFVSAALTRDDGRAVGQLISGYSTESIQMAVRHANMLAAAIGAGSFLAFAAMLYAIARSVSQPITNVVQRIEALQNGDLETGVPESVRKDEIGRLGLAVVSFRDTLRESKRLEKERRQAELEKQEIDKKLRFAEDARKAAEHEETMARAAREKERMEQERAADKEREAARSRQMSEQRAVVEGLQRGLSALARGDLACLLKTPFPCDYEELRKDFNATVIKLNSSVGKSLDKVATIRTEFQAISDAAIGLSKRTESQATNVEATSTALGDLANSAKGASQAAKAARDLAASTRGKAENGSDVVKETAEAMKQIEERSSQIARITGVIDDIAFQTNLLALNAGVEAARAGEKGHGFAVVAAEVRALSGRSAEAAREISEIIGASIETIERGSELVDKSSTALKGILASVAEISDRVVDVAEKSNTQTDKLEELDTAVRELDHTTQQNAAMFEETSAAIENVARETNLLSQEMNFFALDENTKSVSSDAETVECNDMRPDNELDANRTRAA